MMIQGCRFRHPCCVINLVGDLSLINLTLYTSGYDTLDDVLLSDEIQDKYR